MIFFCFSCASFCVQFCLEFSPQFLHFERKLCDFLHFVCYFVILCDLFDRQRWIFTGKPLLLRFCAFSLVSRMLCHRNVPAILAVIFSWFSFCLKNSLETYRLEGERKISACVLRATLNSPFGINSNLIGWSTCRRFNRDSVCNRDFNSENGLRNGPTVCNSFEIPSHYDCLADW